MINKKGKSGIRKRMQRALSGLLAVLMVVGLIPVTSMASDTESVFLVAEVDGKITTLSGSEVIHPIVIKPDPPIEGESGPTMFEKEFQVDVSQVTAGNAKWAGWEDEFVTAIITVGGKTWTAVAPVEDKMATKLQFALVNVEADTFQMQQKETEIVVYGANYKSSFDISVDGESKDPVQYGGTYALPDTTSAALGDTETFIGWQDGDGNYYAPGTEVTVKNAMNFTTVAADLNQYIVTFQDGIGNVLQSGVYNAGAEVTAPADPVRAGYEFSGWDPEVVTSAEGNAVYEANWTAAEHTNEIRVDGETAGNVTGYTDTQTTLDASLYVPEGRSPNSVLVSKSGGIYIPVIQNGSECYFTQPEEPVTVEISTAEPEKNTYTATFKTDEAGVYDLQEVANSELPKMPAPDPVKDGYTFIGWDLNGITYTAENWNEMPVESDVTFNAVFEEQPAEFTVTFMTEEGGVFDTKTVGWHGDLGERPDGPVKEGYTFNGWNTSKTEDAGWYYEVNKNYEADTVFYPRYTANDYMVDTDIEAPAEMDLTDVLKVNTADSIANAHVNDVIDVSVTVPMGYYLKSLTVIGADGRGITYATVTESEAYNFTMQAQNVTVKAVFEKTPEGVAVIKFMANGSLFDQKFVPIGQMVGLPEQGNPVKKGYDFVNWTNDDHTPLAPDTLAMGDVVYTANFEAIDYKITKNINAPDEMDQTGVMDVKETAHYREDVPIDIESPDGYYLSAITVVTEGDSGVEIGVFEESQGFNGYNFKMPAENVSVNAEFKAIPKGKAVIKYAVDGDLYDWQLVTKGDVVPMPEKDPEKVGYAFAGWYSNQGDPESKLTEATIAEENETYVAVFEALPLGINTMTEALDGSLPQEAPSQIVTTEYTEANFGDPVKIDVNKGNIPYGYVFAGLSILELESGNGVPVATVIPDTSYSFTMPAEPVTVVALLAKETIEIKFAADNVLVDSVNLPYNTPVTAPKAPEKEGYTFTGWAAEEGTVLEDGVTPATVDVTYAAQYTPNVYTVDAHVAGYDKADIELDRGVNAAEYAFGETVNVTLTVPQGYELVNIIAAEVDGDRQVPVFSKPNAENVYTFTMPDYNVMVTAYLEKVPDHMFVIKYVADGSLYNVEFVAEGESIPVPEQDPVKENNNFLGWLNEDGFLNDATLAAGDTTYTAQFMPVNGYSVTYVEPGQENDVITGLTYGDPFTVKAPVNAEGFIGWAADDGKVYLAGGTYNITGDMVLSAVYSNDKSSYVVSFKGLDGQILYVYLATGANEYTVTAPEIPAVAGYDTSKASWDAGDVTYKAGAAIRGIDHDMELVLTGETANRHRVNINVDPAECGKEVTTANEADFNETVFVNVGTPDGYMLREVRAAGRETGSGIALVKADADTYTFAMPDEDVDIFVTYEAIPAGAALVKFVADGALYDYQIVTKGTTSLAPAAPSKAGADFVNWKASENNMVAAGAEYTVAANAKDVIVYEAQWNAQKYTAEYQSNGGTPDYASVPDIAYGEKVTLPAAPAKEGFAFLGWQDSTTNMLYNAGTVYTVTANVVFTAQWQELPANEYVVKFVDDITGLVYGYDVVAEGGTLAAPPAPVREGYAFENWADSANENNIVKAGAQTNPITKDTIFVPSWKADTYFINTKTTNCSVNLTSNKANYNDEVKFTVDADEDYAVDSVYLQYTLNGTTVVKELLGKDGSYAFFMPGADVTIVASAKQTRFQISKEADDHLAIKDLAKKAAVGDNVTFTVESSHEDYSVGNVYVATEAGNMVPVTVVMDGDKVVYNFTMPDSDVTVYAQEVKNQYTVYYLDSDNTILDMVAVKSGDTIQAKEIETPAGYTFKEWKQLMSDKTYAANAPIKVEADMYLQAVYEGIESKVYAGVTDNLLILKADQGKDMSNSVDLLNSRANALAAKTGTTVYFQVAAQYNWMIDAITITSKDGNTDLAVAPTLIAKSVTEDAEKNECGLFTYAFTMPAESVEINVYTIAREYNVKVVENIEEAGTYTINGYTTTNHNVAQGSEVEIAVTPEAGYQITNVVGTYTNKNGNVSQVDGTWDGSVYRFPMVAFDVTVDIEYTAIPYNVNVTNSNGTALFPGTYNPQAAGEAGTALETFDVDNKGYIALLDGEGNAVWDDGSNVGIYYPANAAYNVGSQVTFSVETYRGWTLESVNVTYEGGTKTCQTTLKDGVYYFTMPAAEDVNIAANFVKANYAITKEVKGESHGTIEMNGLVENQITAAYKEDVNVAVTPEDGYYVKSISYALADTDANDFSNGVNYVSDQLTDTHDSSHAITFAVPSSDVKVTVEYAAIDYTLVTDVNGIAGGKVNATEGGKIELSTDLANAGDKIGILALPEYGYRLVSLVVANAVTEEPLIHTVATTQPEEGSLYYFNMPADSVCVFAVFEKVDYVVTYLNYDNSVVGMEGVIYKEEANVAGFVNNVVAGPVGQHFVGWTSEDVETPVTDPSVNNADFVVVKDTIVKAQFAYDQTKVVFDATVNGKVESEGRTAPAELDKLYKDKVTFTATPDAGYEVDTITVSTHDKDGNPMLVQYKQNADGSYSFHIPATYKDSVHKVQSEDVIVNVTFKTITYTLSEAADSGTNGTVAINGLVSTQTSFNYQYNDAVSITATPNSGYYVASIVTTDANGNVFKETGLQAAPAMDTPAGNPLELAFNMPDKDLTYKVTYAKIDYSITTVFNDVQGTVTTDPAGKAQIDDIVNVTVTPKKGYALKSLTVTYENGEKSVALTGVDTNKFTFTMPAEAVTVTALFTEVTYTAKLNQTGEGDVTLNTYYTSTMNADYLDTVTVNVAPAAGWYLDSITVTGDAQVGNVAVSPAIDRNGGDYTFTMPNCDVKVDVVLKKVDYKITTVSDPVQGKVTTTPAGGANVGDVVKVKVAPEKGYKLEDLAVTYEDGKKSVALTKVSENNYTFTMPAADVTVTAVYTEVTYKAVLEKEGKGTVRINGFNTTKIDADYLDKVTVNITPDAGWELISLKVAGGDVAVTPAVDAVGGEYTFTMPNYDVTISVVMERIGYQTDAYAVNFYEDGHGKVTMNSEIGKVDDKMVITADPDDGYRVKRVTVTDEEGNAVPVSFVSETKDYVETWSFTMPASAVDVKVTFEAYAASYYTDCRTDNWYYDAVTFVTDRGFFLGMTDNLFGPDVDMTREMFVTVLGRMEGVDVNQWAGVDSGYEDVDINGWYAPYVAWAKEAGVATGYNNEVFGVSDSITREQLFTMMYRYAQYKGIDTNVDYPQFMDRYTDVDEISDWAYEALVWCVSEGVAKGMTDTTINPLDTASRAHAAQMFQNYCDNAWYP